MVKTLMNGRKIRQAEQLLQAILSAHPHEASALFLLGLIALDAGTVKQAEDLFRLALKTRPHMPMLHFNLGLCLGRQNRFEMAIRAFETVLTLDPLCEAAQTQIALHKDRWQRFKVVQGDKSIKIGLLTTLWGRPEVTQLVLEHYTNMDPGHDVEFVKLAVGSEGKVSRNLCEAAGWMYVEHENCPLSRKWQAGLDALKPMAPDFIITLGSDDVITPDFFQKITWRCPLDGCTGLFDFWFLDVGHRQMGYWSEMQRTTPFGGGYVRTLGAGRCYSRNVLDDLGWQLWRQAINSGLDGLAEMRMIRELHRKPTCYGLQDLDTLAVDIKTGQNLWQFNDYNYSAVLDEAKTLSVLTDAELLKVLSIKPFDDQPYRQGNKKECLPTRVCQSINDLPGAEACAMRRNPDLEPEQLPQNDTSR